MQYLQLRHRTYHFRYKVPPRFRDLIHKSEIRRSLHTDSYSQAVAKIAAKIPIISKINQMQSPANPQLKALFDELSDFSKVDSLDSFDRQQDSDVIAGYREAIDQVNEILFNGGKVESTFAGTTAEEFFADWVKTKPPADIAQMRDFQRLFVMMKEVQLERALHDRSDRFRKLFRIAKDFVEEVAPLASALAPQPVYRLSQAWHDFVAWKMSSQKPWTDKIQKEQHNFFEIMLCVWGDIAVTDVTKQHIRDLLNCMKWMPQRNRKPYNKMPISEVVALALDEDVPEDDLAGKGPTEVKKKCQSFFSAYLTDERDMFVKPPTDGVKWEYKSTSYAMFSDTEVRKLRSRALKESDMMKWMVLLGMYTGARQGDLVSIRKQDIRLDADTQRHYIYIPAGKTEAAQRRIPIHKDLVQFGFMELVASADDYLLPNAKRKQKTITDQLRKWFAADGIEDSNEKGQRKRFHSFRHTFITKARGAGASTAALQQVVGHEITNAGVTNIYTHDFPIRDLLDVVDMVSWD